MGDPKPNARSPWTQHLFDKQSYSKKEHKIATETGVKSDLAYCFGCTSREQTVIKHLRIVVTPFKGSKMTF